MPWAADDVEVTGVVIRQWGRDVPGARCEVTLGFMANHVTQLRAQKAALQVHPAATHASVEPKPVISNQRISQCDLHNSTPSLEYPHVQLLLNSCRDE